MKFDQLVYNKCTLELDLRTWAYISGQGKPHFLKIEIIMSFELQTKYLNGKPAIQTYHIHSKLYIRRSKEREKTLTM